MLRDEIAMALEVFESYGMTEKQQKKIVSEGVYFDFTYGDPDPQGRNVKMDFFEFSRFLRICQIRGVVINVDHLLANSYDFKYENIVRGLKQSGIL